MKNLEQIKTFAQMYRLSVQEKVNVQPSHLERGLAKNETALTKTGYDNWFVNSFDNGISFYRRPNDLRECIGCRKEDVSSVYVFFDQITQIVR